MLDATERERKIAQLYKLDAMPTELERLLQCTPPQRRQTIDPTARYICPETGETFKYADDVYDYLQETAEFVHLPMRHNAPNKWNQLIIQLGFGFMTEAREIRHIRPLKSPAKEMRWSSLPAIHTDWFYDAGYLRPIYNRNSNLFYELQHGNAPIRQSALNRFRDLSPNMAYALRRFLIDTPHDSPDEESLYHAIAQYKCKDIRLTKRPTKASQNLVATLLDDNDELHRAFARYLVYVYAITPPNGSSYFWPNVPDALKPTMNAARKLLQCPDIDVWSHHDPRTDCKSRYDRDLLYPHYNTKPDDPPESKCRTSFVKNEHLSAWSVREREGRSITFDYSLYLTDEAMSSYWSNFEDDLISAKTEPVQAQFAFAITFDGIDGEWLQPCLAPDGTYTAMRKSYQSVYVMQQDGWHWYQTKDGRIVAARENLEPYRLAATRLSMANELICRHRRDRDSNSCTVVTYDSHGVTIAKNPQFIEFATKSLDVANLVKQHDAAIDRPTSLQSTIDSANVFKEPQADESQSIASAIGQPYQHAEFVKAFEQGLAKRQTIVRSNETLRDTLREFAYVLNGIADSITDTAKTISSPMPYIDTHLWTEKPLEEQVGWALFYMRDELKKRSNFDDITSNEVVRTSHVRAFDSAIENPDELIPSIVVAVAKRGLIFRASDIDALGLSTLELKHLMLTGEVAHDGATWQLWRTPARSVALANMCISDDIAEMHKMPRLIKYRDSHQITYYEADEVSVKPIELPASSFNFTQIRLGSDRPTVRKFANPVTVFIEAESGANEDDHNADKAPIEVENGPSTSNPTASMDDNPL